MLRRNSQRLCKFAVCLAALVLICYTFGKCDDFVPVLFKKLDGFTDQFNKLLPQLNTMLKSRLNYTALTLRQEGNEYDLKSKEGSYLRGKDEKPAETTNKRDKVQKPSKDNSQSKQEFKDAENEFLRQSDFIKVFAKFTERQNFEAKRRQGQFENILKNLTKILVDIQQKRQDDSTGIEGNKNERKQRETSGALKKPNYFGEDEPLERRPFTSQTRAEQHERTTEEELTVRKEIETGINWTAREHLIPKTPMLSQGEKKLNIGFKKSTEINLQKTGLPETMLTKELTFRIEKGIINRISSTSIKHLVLKTPEPSNQKPSLSVDKSAQALFKTDVVEPNSTLALKVNYPTRKTELRKRNITTRPSYNALITEANLPRAKTDSKRQITTMIKALTTLKPAKRLMDENTLNRRAELFFKKMKNFGITYNESIFIHKGQPNSGIFYREVSPVTAVKNKLTIFLLHDSHYDSKAWLSIGILYSLATHGYRVIALDQPGHGMSKNASEPPTNVEKLKFLVSFMLTVAPKSPRVLVSPGKSGVYSVPMVISASVMLKGVVFISTTYTEEYLPTRYDNVHLPALVVYGKNDNKAFLGEFLESMHHLINSGRFHPIQHAGHDCYMEQPDAFHEIMTDFLLKISQKDKTRKHARAQKI